MKPGRCKESWSLHAEICLKVVADFHIGDRDVGMETDAHLLARIFHTAPWLSHTPRRYAPPLFIEKILNPRDENPLYQEGCPQGGVCGIGFGCEISGLATYR